jgi:hypothetical protein
MKYKIEFTGEAQLMFAMMAKLLPDELNVHVEEIVDQSPGKTQSVIEKLIAQQPKLVAPPNQRKEHFKHPSGKTVQDFVIEFLKTRPSATWAQMSHHVVTLGYNKSSINNAVVRLVYKKVVEKVTPGVYRLTKQAKSEHIKSA